MPGMQKAKSQFNVGAAIAAHAMDETKYSQDYSNLPAGIPASLGVARLVKATLGKFKPGKAMAGEMYLMLTGSAHEPRVFHEVVKGWTDDGTKDGKVEIVAERDVRCAGIQFNLILPLCETPEGYNHPLLIRAKAEASVLSADDNAGLAANKLREVCGPDCLADLGEDLNDFEARLQMLAETGSFFKYSTRASECSRDRPEQRSFVTWFSNKGLEDYQPDAGGVVVEATKPAPSTNGTHAKAAPAKSPEPVAADEPEDLNALAEAAGDENAEGQVAAMERLRDLASEKGIDVEAKDDDGNDLYADWSAVVAAIEAGGEEAPDEPEPFVPVAKTIYHYQLKDAKGKPKTDKAGKKVKPIEVEVITVNKGKETVSVLDNRDRKTKILDVPWDELIVD